MTKEMKAPPKKVGSAPNVYTTHFIRARLILLASVPISPGLGLPFHKGRARVKFGSAGITFGTAKSFTLQNLPELNHFLEHVPFLSEAVPKIFRIV